jgi:hypothetical protein
VCVAPLSARGAKGEEEYPQYCVGVTSEDFMVSKRGARRNTSMGEHILILAFGYGIS